MSIAVILASCAVAADQPGVRAELQLADLRKPAPEFALQDVSGKLVRLNEYRGKVVLLDFWATWCHGCKQEIPWFVEFDRKYRSSGLVVVGISMDGDGWKVVTPFLKTAGVPYQIVLGDEATAKKYGIEGMPDTFLIDREGRIAAAYNGMVDSDDLGRNIQNLLGQTK
jgi:cytochrome c biogenesis protein CcmG/thiol:disulfide interchange protein DsbE